MRERCRGTSQRILVLRTGFNEEGRAIADLIAHTQGCRALFIETEKWSGLGPWLLMRGLLPVFCFELGPGERKVLPTIPAYTGPVCWHSVARMGASKAQAARP